MTDKATSYRKIRDFAQVPGFEPSVGSEPTMTPGVFYHGAPHCDLAEFRSQAEVYGFSGARTGLYFSQSPTYAICYALARGGGSGVRLYRVELVTRSATETLPGSGLAESTREAEERLCSDAINAGHDCLISREAGMIWEVAVFDKAAIRPRSRMEPANLLARQNLQNGLYFASPSLPGPAYAPNAARLYGSRARAERELGAGANAVTTVGTDERIAIFADEAAWPYLDLAWLHREHVDVIIDPETGECLVLDRSMALLLNRTLMRRYKAQRSRNLKQQVLAKKRSATVVSALVRQDQPQSGNPLLSAAIPIAVNDCRSNC